MPMNFDHKRKGQVKNEDKLPDPMSIVKAGAPEELGTSEGGLRVGRELGLPLLLCSDPAAFVHVRL